MDRNKSKRIASNVVYLYIRMLLTMVVSLFTVRVILKALGPVDYGVYTSIGGVIASLSFISTVLANASQRFFSFELGKGKQSNLSEVFNTILTTYIIVSIGLVFIAETVGCWFVVNKMNLVGTTTTIQCIYQFALASFIITLLANPFQALIIANEKMKIYAYVCIVEVLLKLGIALWISICPSNKLIYYAILMFVSTLTTNFIYVFICCKKLLDSRVQFIISRDSFKQVFQYVSWTLFGTIAYVFNTQGLNIILNLFYGPIANAAYSISTNTSSAVNNLASNFYAAIRPPLIKSYAEGDNSTMTILFNFSSKVVFVLLFIVAFPIFVRTEFVLKIWLGDVMEYMVSFVRLLLVYSLVLKLSDPITTLIQAANKVKVYHGVVDSFTMLSLPLAYFALSKGAHAEYVFIISTAVICVAHVLRLFILRNYIKVSIKEYLVKIVIPIIMTIVISGGLIYFIDAYTPKGFAYDICTLFVSFLVSALACCFCIFNTNERKRIIKLIKR